MIRASCKIENCNMVAQYYPPITLEQIKKCPPFHNMPLLEGEHEHEWIITEVKLDR